MNHSLNRIMALAAAFAALVSCNFLDQNENTYQTSDYQFSCFDNVKRVCSHVYSYLDVDTEWSWSTQNCATDDAVYAWESIGIKTYYNGTWSPRNTINDRFAHYYAGIAQDNYFLENAPSDFPETQYLQDYKDRMQQLRNFPYEVRFLRAWYHFELMRRYGDIVIMDHSVAPAEVNSLVPSDFHTVTEWIVGELDAIIPELPVSYSEFVTGRTNRVTRGAAMAFKARALLYDASPLHNPQGDKERYRKAAEAAKQVLDSGWYTLAKEQKINNFNAKGYIFGVIRSASNGLESSNFPMGVEGGNSGTCPSQNLAEAFDLLDGTPFDWDKPEHRAIALDPSKRDPRFGETFYMDGSLFKGVPLEMWEGGQNALPKKGATPTSYYLKKNLVEETSFVTGNAISYPHIYPIIRYAEMYLIYAEALYLATGDASFKGSLGGVNYTLSPLEALNAVRERAGVGALQSSPDFLAAVQKENRVEFAFENHRFWDTRRWMIQAGDTDIYGLKIVRDSQSGEISYTKQLVQTRVWEDKYYLYPYSDAERYKNPNLQLNPGW